jgi:hypothetical protein
MTKVRSTSKVTEANDRCRKHIRPGTPRIRDECACGYWALCASDWFNRNLPPGIGPLCSKLTRDFVTRFRCNIVELQAAVYKGIVFSPNHHSIQLSACVQPSYVQLERNSTPPIDNPYDPSYHSSSLTTKTSTTSPDLTASCPTRTLIRSPRHRPPPR